MRTKLDIDDDVLQAVKELAKVEKKTAGEVLSQFARRALTQTLKPFDVSRLEIRNGIPILPSRGGIVTKELIDKLIEESGE